MGTGSQPSSGRSSVQLPEYTPRAVDGGSAGPGQDSHPVAPHWAHWKSSDDPRTSSAQSLVSGTIDQDGRRRLLLVYLHGFMGDDSSFRSFPAHVHNCLKEALTETHVIHSKIYPRYKTYKALEVAGENFSRWLEPHESPTTDVVLLGHSMGGLLAAEVVLIPSHPGSDYPFRHRILGTISLDAPLLGLHPGIIASGIASIFRPAPGSTKVEDGKEFSQGADSSELSAEPSVSPESSPPGAASPPATSYPPPAEAIPDPHFNPPFFNDVIFKDRGWFRNIAHFAKKHKSENLFEATTSHIMSHLEFGGCLADYPGMRSRYHKLRALEDVDDLAQGSSGAPARVRFVNYYTASTGKIKEPRAKLGDDQVESSVPSELGSPANGKAHQESRLDQSTPIVLIEDDTDREELGILQELEPIPEPCPQDLPFNEGCEGQPDMSRGTPTAPAGSSTPDTEMPQSEGNRLPESETSMVVTQQAGSDGAVSLKQPISPSAEPDFDLPAIPDIPPAPIPVDFERYTNKETRKQAEKEAKRVQKAYETAVKNRDKAIKERQRMVEKWRRRAARDAEKREKQLQKEIIRGDTEGKEQDMQLGLEHLSLHQPGPKGEKDKQKGKRKKERKFCMLPSKINGRRDSTWLRIYMEDVDEVGAHCGLFLPGPHYEILVGDVVMRIMNWVHDDASKRMILGMN